MGRKTKMNKLTSPELLAQVNPENKQLLNDYLDYLKSVDRSESTCAAYRNDIEIAFVWGLKHNYNKRFVDWTKRNIVAYQNWLINENGHSPARVRRLKASLSSLSNFIENILDDEFPNFRNIVNKIEAPANKPVREKTVLTDDDIQSILDELVARQRYRLACFTALAAYSGRRKAELCRFKVSDFSDDRLVCGGSLWKSAPIRTKGRGRGGKVISCYVLAHKFRPYLDLWMKCREEHGIESEWLFPDSRNGDGVISVATVNSYMNTLSRMTGMNIYAHSFRHYFTTMLSNEGIPDSVIKEIVKWEDVGMVSVYVDRSTEETLDMYFGEDGIKKREQRVLSDL
jgi:integrase